MEVIAPLPGQPVAVGVPRVEQARVVEVRFGDHGRRAAGLGGDFVRERAEVLQQVHGPLVLEGVHGVQPQAVHVVVPQPHGGVVQDVAAHLVRVRAVQVDRVAPGVALPRLQVGPEPGKVVSAGAEVVVDHVLDDAQAGGVGGVHEALVRGGSAVAFVHGVPEDAVVAPVVGAVEAVDRQQLHEVDAQLRQVVQLPGGGVQCSLRRERAHVEFVDHGALEPAARPLPVRPLVAAGVERAREGVDAGGLAPGPGVRQRCGRPRRAGSRSPRRRRRAPGGVHQPRRRAAPAPRVIGYCRPSASSVTCLRVRCPEVEAFVPCAGKVMAFFRSPCRWFVQCLGRHQQGHRVVLQDLPPRPRCPGRSVAPVSSSVMAAASSTAVSCQPPCCSSPRGSRVASVRAPAPAALPRSKASRCAAAGPVAATGR